MEINLEKPNRNMFVRSWSEQVNREWNALPVSEAEKAAALIPFNPEWTPLQFIQEVIENTTGSCEQGRYSLNDCKNAGVVEPTLQQHFDLIRPGWLFWTNSVIFGGSPLRSIWNGVYDALRQGTRYHDDPHPDAYDHVPQNERHPAYKWAKLFRSTYRGWEGVIDARNLYLKASIIDSFNSGQAFGMTSLVRKAVDSLTKNERVVLYYHDYNYGARDALSVFVKATSLPVTTTATMHNFFAELLAEKKNQEYPGKAWWEVAQMFMKLPAEKRVIRPRIIQTTVLLSKPVKKA